MRTMQELAFDVVSQATLSAIALKEEMLGRGIPRDQELARIQIQGYAPNARKESIRPMNGDPSRISTDNPSDLMLGQKTDSRALGLRALKYMGQWRSRYREENWSNG